MMNNLLDAIDEFSVDLCRIRLLQPTVEKGRVTSKPQEDRHNFRGSFQPVKQKELERLPEGMRNKGAAKLYTACELFTADISSGKLPDKVEYRGVIYQVESIDDWMDLGGYYKVLLTRMDR